MKQRSRWERGAKSTRKGRAPQRAEETSERPATENAGAAAPKSRSATTRRLVIAAAARVFADEGFVAATKERIGAVAGVSHQTVRDYFRTKELVLEAIVSEFWHESRTALVGVEGGGTASVLAARDKLAALAKDRPHSARCAFHTVLHAGARGGALVVEEEKKFREELEKVLSKSTGLSGAAARARTELLMAALRSSASSAEDETRAGFAVVTSALLAKG